MQRHDPTRTHTHQQSISQITTSIRPLFLHQYEETRRRRARRAARFNAPKPNSGQVLCGAWRERPLWEKLNRW